MTPADVGFDIAVPVVIAGGGACGAVAALAARDAGADVILLEQDLTPRGTTSMSQGLICAAGTAAQRQAGVEDSPEIFYADIIAKTKGQTDHALARLIADQAGPCIDWLTERHDIPFGLDVRFRPAYGHTRLRVHGWLSHGGADLLQALHARLAAAGVDVVLGAKVAELISDASARVLGVEIERPGGGRERIGCDALILAMGGFAANHAMVANHMPEAARAWYNGHEGASGDAMVLGRRLGAALADMGAYQGYGMLTDPQGLSVPPPVIVEGGLMVNTRGERFLNEAEDIAGMVHPVLAQPGGTAWVVFDAVIEQRCAYIPETQQLMALNAAKTGDTVEALAQEMGVESLALSAALNEARDAYERRRADATGRVWADDAPPSPPFRALKVRGAIYHTQGGLEIDGHAQVKRSDGSLLPNLYAGGGSARGVSGPSYWGYLPAMGLCAATTLGRVAGAAAAGKPLSG